MFGAGASLFYATGGLVCFMLQVSGTRWHTLLESQTATSLAETRTGAAQYGPPSTPLYHHILIGIADGMSSAQA